MDTIDFWIPISTVPAEDIPEANRSDKAIRITLPKTCPDCGKDLPSVSEGGSSQSHSHFKIDACIHFYTYPQVWQNRIQTPILDQLRIVAVNYTYTHCTKCKEPYIYGEGPEICKSCSIWSNVV